MKKIITTFLLLAALLLGACKEEENRLTIKASLRGQPVKQIDLTCKKGQTCPWLEAFRKVDLEPVPEGALCTRIYGGPEEIDLFGQIDGQGVTAQFNRSGGCEIKRFETLAYLLAAAKISKEDLFPKGTL